MNLGKTCVRCNRWYPLFMFKRDTRKFQLKIALGKVRACRLCIYKEKDPVVRWDGKDFTLVTRTRWQKIKEFFKR